MCVVYVIQYEKKLPKLRLFGKLNWLRNEESQWLPTTEPQKGYIRFAFKSM